ncbi:MAG: hypothetical protein L3J22_04960 [Xanthomonadales bacterium]|nr:hypothetical protein [Xanthomonadales bacterium]
MKLLIKDNPLGMALLGVAGLLLLVTLLLPVLRGGVPEVSIDPQASELSSQQGIAEISQLEPLSKFAVIKQRPLFNEDRKPVDISSATDGDDLSDAALADTPEDKPLETDLTGIVITNEHKIALLWDRTNKTTMRVAEGSALEGDLSAWIVEKVDARKISLKNRQGKTVELELLMFTQSLGKPPARSAAKKSAAKSQANGRARTKAKAVGADKVAGKDTAAATEKTKNTPMSAADFMRQGLAKRKAARDAQKKKTNAAKQGDG